MIRLRRCLIVLGIAVGGLVATASASAGSLPQFGAHNCHGGTIKAGVYASLRVSGNCTVPTGATVHVNGEVFVAPGATLNAVTQSTFNVGGDLIRASTRSSASAATTRSAAPPRPTTTSAAACGHGARQRS